MMGHGRDAGSTADSMWLVVVCRHAVGWVCCVFLQVVVSSPAACHTHTHMALLSAV